MAKEILVCVENLEASVVERSLNLECEDQNCSPSSATSWLGGTFGNSNDENDDDGGGGDSDNNDDSGGGGDNDDDAAAADDMTM